MIGHRRAVFTNIGAREGMNRSALRGPRNVNVQWKPYCMVSNLEKIGRHGLTHN